MAELARQMETLAAGGEVTGIAPLADRFEAEMPVVRRQLQRLLPDLELERLRLPTGGDGG
jgi:hypothetical protein